MTADPRFAELVSLACHDLRTPLATVYGFARTLARLDGLEEPASRYVEMIDAASVQLSELLDALHTVSRIERGRYEPAPRALDTLALVRAAAERVGSERVSVAGDGGRVVVDPEDCQRALASLSLAALRHGPVERVELSARGEAIALAPVTAAARPIVVGEQMRDLGAAVAVRVVSALGGSVDLEGETLLVRLPAERG